MVEPCDSIRPTSRPSTSGQLVLFARLAMSGTGTCTVSSTVLAARGATMVVGACPDRKRASSSGGRTVADSPMRYAGGPSRSSCDRSWSRSSDSARCAPRLPPAMAWISSTITVWTPARVSRAAEVSIRNSDSGVVISTSGGCAMSWRRPAGGVSPERTPTLMSGAARPWRSAILVSPASGVRRLRSTSTASAFSGDTYSTRVPVGRSGPDGRVAGLARVSRAHRNAASVLPDPVGAITRVLCPSATAAQASACAVVGAAKVVSNHSRVMSLNRPRGSDGSAGVTLTPPWCQRPMTTGYCGWLLRHGAGCRHGVGQSGWDLRHPRDGVEQRVRARVGEPVGLGRGVHDALTAYFEGEGQPAVQDHPQVPLDFRFELLSRDQGHDLADAGHDMFQLPVLGLVVDAEQNRVGTAQTHVSGPRGLRIRLVVGHVGQHTGPELLEHRHAGRWRGVGRRVQTIAL